MKQVCGLFAKKDKKGDKMAQNTSALAVQPPPLHTDPLDEISSAGTTTTTQKLRGYLNVKHNPTSKKARANPLRRVRL